MTQPFSHIRLPHKLLHPVLYPLLILALGIILGIFAKWLDNLALSDTIFWHRIFAYLDLRNVFSSFYIWLLLALTIAVYSATPWRASLNVFLFFLGMCISYHLYTIFFSGFNPRYYMLIWYGFTLFSPFLAFICWYGKGGTTPSIIIDSCICAVMLLACCSLGFWYFNFISILSAIIFMLTIIVLYYSPKNTLISCTIAFILAYLIRCF